MQMLSLPSFSLQCQLFSSWSAGLRGLCCHGQASLGSYCAIFKSSSAGHSSRIPGTSQQLGAERGARSSTEAPRLGRGVAGAFIRVHLKNTVFSSRGVRVRVGGEERCGRASKSWESLGFPLKSEPAPSDPGEGAGVARGRGYLRGAPGVRVPRRPPPPGRRARARRVSGGR